MGVDESVRGSLTEPVRMSRSPSPLPDDLPYAVFTAEEAHACGVSTVRLRATDLVTVARGLYARRDVPIAEADIVAAYCRIDPEVFAAGLTAAQLWEFQLPGDLGEQVTSPPGPPRRVGGRTVHGPGAGGIDRRLHMATSGSPRRSTALIRWSRRRTEADQVYRNPRWAMTSRTHTLLDLGEDLSIDALVAISDHLVRRPRPYIEGRTEPYATIPQLTFAAETFAGRGALAVRAAVSLTRVGSDSPAETRLRLALVRGGLPEPLANVQAGESVQNLGEPDLHWPQWKVAVEHEGPHHLTPEQLARDIARGERRRKAGWIEVRTTAKDLRDGCRIAITRTREALTSRGWRG